MDRFIQQLMTFNKRDVDEKTQLSPFSLSLGICYLLPPTPHTRKARGGGGGGKERPFVIMLPGPLHSPCLSRDGEWWRGTRDTGHGPRDTGRGTRDAAERKEAAGRESCVCVCLSVRPPCQRSTATLHMVPDPSVLRQGLNRLSG